MHRNKINIAQQLCLLALGNLFCLNCSTNFWWKVSSVHETLAQIPFKNKALMVLEQEAFI